MIASAALAAALSMVSTSPVFAAGKEKCYGIAEAGQNDCANLAGTHSCAAQSTLDKDIGEWKLVAKGTCKSLKGYTKKEAMKIYKAKKKS